MSSGGGGAGRGGYSSGGVLWVGGGTRGGHGESANDDGVGQVNPDLNPNRRRGFGQNRFETPNLN